MSVVGPRLQPTLVERVEPGRGSGKVPHPPGRRARPDPGRGATRRRRSALPELNEPEVVRHFVNLSQLNYAVDTGFYPLGSCTMKYNPKVNEWAARLPGFARAPPAGARRDRPGHARAPVGAGALLAEISGMRAVTLQPAAGAHGELTGILMIRAYHRARGDTERTRSSSPTRPTARTRPPPRWPASRR